MMRKWLAWKLVRIAHRLHDPEWVEIIAAQAPSGHEIEITILSNEYGCGILSTSGMGWDNYAAGLKAVSYGWTFTWSDPIRVGDYINS